MEKRNAEEILNFCKNYIGKVCEIENKEEAEQYFLNAITNYNVMEAIIKRVEAMKKQ